jgi:hypothetical protein
MKCRKLLLVNAVGVIFAAVNSVASNFKVIANSSVRADTISEDELKNHQGHEGSRRFCLEGLAFRKSFVYLHALGGQGFRIRPAPARLI